MGILKKSEVGVITELREWAEYCHPSAQVIWNPPIFKVRIPESAYGRFTIRSFPPVRLHGLENVQELAIFKLELTEENTKLLPELWDNKLLFDNCIIHEHSISQFWSASKIEFSSCKIDFLPVYNEAAFGMLLQISNCKIKTLGLLEGRDYTEFVQKFHAYKNTAEKVIRMFDPSRLINFPFEPSLLLKKNKTIFHEKPKRNVFRTTKQSRGKPQVRITK